ncbi:uncharacterized protein LOC131254236 [Magnolia sinica]|uniref:uncharacterized protein LOC131254236 n=1 Tax=Magnolia sinica TaxID=86752 RepID=UPI002658A145|nr:uncharacterized protein LOC131254236 [Magnolia sinica]
MEAIMEEIEPLFTTDIMQVQLSDRFCMPQITPFLGTNNPLEHLKSFKVWMELHNASTAVMYQAISLTLTGAARKWFKQLKSHSISSFSQLGQVFVMNFIGVKERLKPASHLLNVVQKEGELLKDYIKRFNLKVMQVQKHSEEIALISIMGGLRDPKFLFSLDKNPPTMMIDLLNRLQKYYNVEEASTL